MPLTISTAGVTALAIFALTALTACSSDAEPAPGEETDTAAVEESAPEETIEEPVEESAEPAGSEVIRYEVGDAFTMGDEFFGLFDVTYMGIADMGVMDEGGADSAPCYAVLLEATLQEIPADNPDPELGGANVDQDVLDANGEIASPNFSTTCADSILDDNGYPLGFDVEWAAGEATDATITKLTITPEDLERADSVDIDPTGSFVLDFEIVASW